MGLIHRRDRSWTAAYWITPSPRSAMVLADTDVECSVLNAKDFDVLTTSSSLLAAKLLRNLAVEFSPTVRRNNNALRLCSRFSIVEPVPTSLSTAPATPLIYEDDAPG